MSFLHSGKLPPPSGATKKSMFSYSHRSFKKFHATFLAVLTLAKFAAKITQRHLLKKSSQQEET
jgi:hypothetical protein